MLQSDELPLRDLLSLAGIFLVAAFFMALGAVLSVARKCDSVREVGPKISQVAFVSDYVIVLVLVLMPAVWVASIGIIQEGIPVFIAAVSSFFTTGLAVEQHAERAVKGAIEETGAKSVSSDNEGSGTRP